MRERYVAGPLAGLRVVELSTEITGPYAGKLFADAGADVVKVEPHLGDSLRRWTASGQALGKGENGALFEYLNSGKRGIVADLESGPDRDFVRRLALDADIVIESFGPGGAEAFGLGWDTIHAESPHTTLVSISKWGGTGPWADRPGTEFTLQAATGSTGQRGLPSRGPVGSGGRIGEWIPGVYAAVGGMTGWLSARRTGNGHHVDLSIFECLCLCMTIFHDLNSQFFPGPLPQSIDTPSIEPAKDGWVGLCTVTGQQWKDFCALIGQAELGEDPRFYDAKARMEHIDFIHGIVHAYTKEHTVDEIIELMSLGRIPVNPLGNGQTLLEMDHLKERNVFVENPAGFRQPRPPYRLGSDERKLEVQPAPKLGEHTDEIRAEQTTRDPAAPAGGGPLPFEGLRVLDLTAFWAGPVGTSYLAELGADVIKLESIQRPDAMRFAGSVMNETMWEFNPIHHGCNSSKRNLTLHLDSEDGMTLAKRLMAKADVIVENFSPRVMENWGLDWETIHALNPRTILVRMPSFGLDGPWRDRVGFAMNIEQVSGLAWLTGYDDLPLVVRGACDPMGGQHAVFALMLALEERRRTGEGQLVEVPLLEPALNITAEQVIEWSAYGELIEREQNRGPAAAPQGVYPCSDRDEMDASPGWIAIAVATDEQWEALRRALGDPAWAREPAFATRRGRRAAHDTIDEELRRWTSARTRQNAAATLRTAGVPAEECINSHTLFPNPQLEDRGFFQVMEHSLVGPVRYPGLPMRFSGLPRALRQAPTPLLGQHNEEILRNELGLSEDEIKRLRENKVIGTRPAFMEASG
ncbi:MAG: CoA transferase [Deltaproteobacteria bacterium]|nr:CoA transferase [Deltaproteobacteria bacterium]MBW2393785.1 CoA transferase [Deltaproteobacteria bacterium]